MKRQRSAGLMVMVLLAGLTAGIAHVASAQVITGIERHNPDGDSWDTEPNISPTPLAEDALCFVDRNHQYNNLPGELVNLEYIRVANEDKDNPNYELDVTLSQSATVYLLLDNRLGHGSVTGTEMMNPDLNAAGMNWVIQMGFADTGLNVGIDEVTGTGGDEGDIDNWSSFYSANFPAGVVTLLAQDDPTDPGMRNMYGVAAKINLINTAPNVYPGTDTVIYWPTNTVELEAMVTDDGLPDPPGKVSLQWTRTSAPLGGSVQFDPNEFVDDPNVTFNIPGSYTLKLTANDGELQDDDDVTITVREQDNPSLVFPAPEGGWTYIYAADPGDDIIGPTDHFDSLDGSWDHHNGSDEWSLTHDKVYIDAGVLKIIDNVSTTSGTGDDRKIYFGRNLSDLSIPDDILDSGATLCFRARGNYYLHNEGKGNLGLRQKGGTSPALMSFAFNPDGGGQLDVSDGGGADDASLLYAVDISQFHEYWITVENDNSVPGKTHKVTLWLDGDLIPKAQLHVELPNTAEADYAGINYLTMGCGASQQTGFLDLDFLTFRIGSVEPTGNRPPTIDAGEDQSFRYPCQRAIQLHGVIEDDDPNHLGQLTIQWSQSTGPAPVLFDNASDPNTVVWFSDVGVYQLMLQGSDEVPQEANDIITITVAESILGDLNCDNRIDNLDLDRFVEQWLDSAGCHEYMIGCAHLIGADRVNLGDYTVLAGNWGVEWPTATIVATDPDAAEDGQNPGVFTFTRSGTQGDLTVHYTIGGTATSNDYSPLLTGEVVIPNGQPTATITIIPAEDGESEGVENVQLTLAEGAGYLIGSPDTAAVTILDNDIPSLQSTDLIIELTENPYSYRIIERSTLEVILDQSETQFDLPGGAYTVQSAYNIDNTTTTMDADLGLAGSAKTGHVKFTFDQSDLLKIILSCNDDTPDNIQEEFVDQGEHYYGIWEYPQGQDIDNRGADRDLIGFAGMSDTNYASARAPFYMTTKKYSVYVDTVKLGHYTVAVNGKTRFDFDEEQLTYYIIYGPDYENMFDVFNDLAGPAWMPPDWAFDSVWWRDDDHSDLGHWDIIEEQTIDSAEKNVMATANHLQHYRIPASAIWIDRPYTSGTWGWGNMDFNPASDWFPSGPPAGQYMIDYLEDKGYHLLLWIANRCENELYTEGSGLGYLFSGSRPAADVRRTEVYDWFKAKLSAFVNMGVRGYKVDRGHEGEQPDSAENEVVYLFRELAAEGQMDVHGSDYLIHARNFYDKNRRHLGVWNGDTDSDYGGLRVSIKNALRCGAMNFPYYGSDIGGYLSDSVPQELFTRWLQFGAYSTMMEILIDPGRTIWYDADFSHGADPNLIDMARQFCQDHHDLIPYTKSCMYQAHENGMPVMRQMIFEFPDDTSLYDMWDEYFYGREILVAPVINSGATSRSVYLPQGKWLDYNDKNTVYSGPGNITASAPIDVIPLFVREGAVITRGDILRSNNNWTTGWAPYLRIEFFPYDNTANTFDYYTGGNVRPIACSMPDAGNVDISFLDLGYGGTLEIYCRAYTNVTKNGLPLVEGVGFTYDPVKNLMTISFSGPTTVEMTGVQSIFNPD